MTVLWTDDALGHLDALARYLKHFSQAAANRVVMRIADRLDSVDQFSRQGRIVPEIEHDTVREVLVDRYRIWYWVKGDDIEVLAIFHGARDTRS